MDSYTSASNKPHCYFLTWSHIFTEIPKDTVPVMRSSHPHSQGGVACPLGCEGWEGHCGLVPGSEVWARCRKALRGWSTRLIRDRGRAVLGRAGMGLVRVVVSQQASQGHSACPACHFTCFPELFSRKGNSDGQICVWSQSSNTTFPKGFMKYFLNKAGSLHGYSSFSFLTFLGG